MQGVADEVWFPPLDEETELLLTVRWIVGGIDIEQDLSPLANLFSAEFHKPIEQSILQLEELARRR